MDSGDGELHLSAYGEALLCFPRYVSAIAVSALLGLLSLLLAYSPVVFRYVQCWFSFLFFCPSPAKESIWLENEASLESC